MRALHLIIFQKSLASFTNKAQRFSTLKNSTVLHPKPSTLVLFTPHNIPYTMEIAYLFISIVHIYIYIYIYIPTIVSNDSRTNYDHLRCSTIVQSTSILFTTNNISYLRKLRIFASTYSKDHSHQTFHKQITMILDTEEFYTRNSAYLFTIRTIKL